MKAIIEYRFNLQNVKSAIAKTKLCRLEYLKHKKQMPNEIPYTERCLQLLNDEFKNLLSKEFILNDTPVIRQQHGEQFYKEKLLTSKILNF